MSSGSHIWKKHKEAKVKEQKKKDRKKQQRNVLINEPLVFVGKTEDVSDIEVYEEGERTLSEAGAGPGQVGTLTLNSEEQLICPFYGCKEALELEEIKEHIKRNHHFIQDIMMTKTKLLPLTCGICQELPKVYLNGMVRHMMIHTKRLKTRLAKKIKTGEISVKTTSGNLDIPPAVVEQWISMLQSGKLREISPKTVQTQTKVWKVKKDQFVCPICQTWTEICAMEKHFFIEHRSRRTQFFRCRFCPAVFDSTSIAKHVENLHWSALINRPFKKMTHIKADPAVDDKDNLVEYLESDEDETKIELKGEVL